MSNQKNGDEVGRKLVQGAEYTPRMPSFGFQAKPSPPPKQAVRHEEGCRCVHCALTRLRQLLHSESPMQLNTHAAPVLRDFEGIPEKDGDVQGTGMSWTATMHRFMSGPDHWGVTRLGMLSIIEVSDACASKHPPHRRPMFTRTLCSQLTYEAAYLGQSLDDLAWLHPELSAEQIHGLLAWALSHAESWRADRFARWTKVPGAEEPLPERRRVA